MSIEQEAIDEIQQAIAANILAGIQSTTTDGTTVVASDPVRQLTALDLLAHGAAASAIISGTGWGIRHKVLLPPGGGGP